MGLGASCPRLFPGKSALGKGWGAWGEGEPLPRRRRPKGGRRPCPLGDAGALRASTAERDRKAAAGPCLLGRKALQASTAERGGPLPPNRQQIVLTGPSQQRPSRMRDGRFFLSRRSAFCRRDGSPFSSAAVRARPVGRRLHPVSRPSTDFPCQKSFRLLTLVLPHSLAWSCPCTPNHEERHFP